MDDTDLWGPRLKEGVLSPPMAKKVEDSEKRLTCRLYKGYYQRFFEVSMSSQVYDFVSHLSLLRSARQL